MNSEIKIRLTKRRTFERSVHENFMKEFSDLIFFLFNFWLVGFSTLWHFFHILQLYFSTQNFHSYFVFDRSQIRTDCLTAQSFHVIEKCKRVFDTTHVLAALAVIYLFASSLKMRGSRCSLAAVNFTLFKSFKHIQHYTPRDGSSVV